ncbi:hypothetical protein TNCV_2834691 [Trichonephila clavipes]|nr:hypothetical protein TNCV_2834691 [Trichonephila clavipes]
MLRRLVGTTSWTSHDCSIQNEKVSNHGSIPITIDCNVVAFVVFEEGFHQPIKRTKHQKLSTNGSISTAHNFYDVPHFECGVLLLVCVVAFEHYSARKDHWASFLPEEGASHHPQHIIHVSLGRHAALNTNKR